MTLAEMHCATCGAPYNAAATWAIKPGQDAVHGHARDMFGVEDTRQPPILLSRPVATVVRHWPKCP